MGLIGGCFDSLFIKKALRKCRILGGVTHVGIKLANSTFTGALGLLQSKRADVWIRPEPNYHNEPWLGFSKPIMMEKLVVGQAIKPQGTVYYNLLNNFNVGFSLTITFLSSILIILALSFLLNDLTHRIRFRDQRRIEISKRIALALGRFQSKRLSAIAVFVLFVHIFIWQTQLFLANNIKTNKVVRSVLKNEIPENC